MNRTQLKTKAKAQIRGNIPVLATTSLIAYIVANLTDIVKCFHMPKQILLSGLDMPDNLIIRYGINIVSFLNMQPNIFNTMLLIISFILSPAIMLSINKGYLNLVKNNIKPSLPRFFKNINSFIKPLLLQIVTTIFVILWSLLFIIPGIVKTISYSAAFYILAENPDITILEAIRESKKLMYGYKMDYFILSLSFFGWYLLGTITCGLAFIYISPYIKATFTNFYLQIKSENEEATAS